MKFIIEWGYYTDGDFSFRPNFDIEFEKEIEKDEEYYDYYGMKIFDSKDFENDAYCMFEARTYVEQLLVDTHVSHTHYYILESIYKMFEPVIDFVNKKEIGTIRRELSGNYDGTFIQVIILDD